MFSPQPETCKHFLIRLQTHVKADSAYGNERLFHGRMNGKDKEIANEMRRMSNTGADIAHLSFEDWDRCHLTTT